MSKPGQKSREMGPASHGSRLYALNRRAFPEPVPDQRPDKVRTPVQSEAACPGTAALRQCGKEQEEEKEKALFLGWWIDSNLVSSDRSIVPRFLAQWREDVTNATHTITGWSHNRRLKI